MSVIHSFNINYNHIEPMVPIYPLPEDLDTFLRAPGNLIVLSLMIKWRRHIAECWSTIGHEPWEFIPMMDTITGEIIEGSPDLLTSVWYFPIVTHDNIVGVVGPIREFLPVAKA